MGMESSNGLMAENTKETGKTVNNTEKEFTSDLIIKRERENGRKEKESDGLKKNSKMDKPNDFIFLLLHL